MNDFYGVPHVPSQKTRFTNWMDLQNYTNPRAAAFFAWADRLVDDFEARGYEILSIPEITPNPGGPIVGMKIMVPKEAPGVEYVVTLGTYDNCTVYGRDPVRWLLNAMKYMVEQPKR